MSCTNQSRVDGVPHFDVVITESNIDTHIKLLIAHIMNSWRLDQLQKKTFDGGATNKLIGYYVNDHTKISKFTEKSDIVLVRIYGEKTEMIIDRAQELRNFVELLKNNMAPPLYCTFSNGYCYKFIEGIVCTTDDFKHRNVIQNSAQCMAKVHSIKLSNSYLNHYKMEASVFTTIRKYISLIPEFYNNKKAQERFKNEVPNVAALSSEVDHMFDIVSHLQSKIVFCHNDLNIPNLIFNKEQGVMHCIDYEYACPNFAAYDIANHFNEFAGNSDVDFTLLPSKETQLWWLRKYLEKINEINCSEAVVSENEVNHLYINVSYFLLVSHLLWGVWALAQAHYSHIDFDYMGYSIICLNEYFSRKDDILKFSA